MKSILFFLLSIVCLKCYVFQEAKLINLTNSQQISLVKISPNGSMFALTIFQGEETQGSLFIYDREGNLLMSRRDHQTRINGIEWLNENQGPITLSMSGRLVFMNDLLENVTVYETGYQLIDRDYVSTSWNVSNNQQYFAFYNQTHVMEWDAVKQVQVGIYDTGFVFASNTEKVEERLRGVINEFLITYAEGGRYLVVRSLPTNDYSDSNVSYFDRLTRKEVKRYWRNQTSWKMRAGKYTNNVAVAYNDDTEYEYTHDSIIGNASLIDLDCEMTYCGSSELIIGGEDEVKVFDLNNNYQLIQDIRGISIDPSLPSCKVPLHCTNESLFVLDYNVGIYIVERILTPPGPKPTPDEDGIPEWIIIVSIVLFALIVLVCFILVCIKQKTGITTYKCFKRCFKRRNSYNDSLYTDTSNDFGR